MDLFNNLIFGFSVAFSLQNMMYCLIGVSVGTLIGVRPALWVSVIGFWAAGWFVFFSPLRHMRDVPRPASASAPVVTS